MSVFGMIAFGWFGIAVVGFIIFGWAEGRWAARGTGKQSRVARFLRLHKLSAALHKVRQAGIEAAPELTLDKVIMRPARRLRVLSVAPGALILLFLWGPYGPLDAYGLPVTLLLTGLVFYAGVYIAAYEASYDDEGITAPDFLFRQHMYPWSSFEGVKDRQNFLVRMKFEGHGKLSLQKYLVGMPTFLTFLSDVEDMNRRT